MEQGDKDFKMAFGVMLTLVALCLVLTLIGEFS